MPYKHYILITHLKTVNLKIAWSIIIKDSDDLETIKSMKREINSLGFSEYTSSHTIISNYKDIWNVVKNDYYFKRVLFVHDTELFFTYLNELS